MSGYHPDSYEHLVEQLKAELAAARAQLAERDALLRERSMVPIGETKTCLACDLRMHVEQPHSIADCRAELCRRYHAANDLLRECGEYLQDVIDTDDHHRQCLLQRIEAALK
jgi:hypothetical protein